MVEKVNKWVLNPLQVNRWVRNISEGKIETELDIERKEALENIRKSIKELLNDNGSNVFRR